MALILSHICTVSVWGNMLRTHVAGLPPVAPPGTRSKITEFSLQARKRMLELMNKLEFKKLVFVTLTYPDQFPTDGHEWKKHLKRFRARLERKFGKVRVLWKLEFQKRGAPHFHLLLLDPPWIEKEWLSLAWYECVGSEDEKHLEYGTSILGVAGEGENGKIIAYVSKYLAKVSDKEHEHRIEWSGRFYGRWNVKTSCPVQIEVDPEFAVRLVACAIPVRGNSKAYVPRDATSCRVFGSRMGSGEWGSRIIDTLEAGGGRKLTGKLDA